MSSHLYLLEQNRVLTLNQPPQIGSVAGDNPTPYYLHFPDLAPPMEWVFPFTYGFSYPLPDVQAQAVQVNSQDTPPGYPVAPTSAALAKFQAYSERLPYSAGQQAQGSSPNWALVGSKLLAAGADQFTTNPVPPTTKSLLVSVAAGTAVVPSVAWVTGVQTQEVYAVSPLGLAVAGSTIVPINGLGDSTYLLQFTSGLNLRVNVYASDLLVATISQGQQHMQRSAPVAIADDQSAIPVTVPLLPATLVQPPPFVGTLAAIATYTQAIANATGKGIECICEVTAGTGNVTFGIQDNDAANNPANTTLIQSLALTIGQFARLRVYPGITPVANGAVADVIGSTPGLFAVVAGNTATYRVETTLLP